MKTDRRDRIFLVGFMGSGKTSVGEHLASEIGFRFIDLDKEIERRRGIPIASIFEQDGEAGFRRLEGIALRDVGSRHDVVIATGGGTLTRPENHEYIRRNGLSVWLDAPLEIMLERCRGGERRPLLGPRDRMEDLFARRLASYRQCDLRVDASVESPEIVARELAGRLSTMVGR